MRRVGKNVQTHVVHIFAPHIEIILMHFVDYLTHR